MNIEQSCYFVLAQHSHDMQ